MRPFLSIIVPIYKTEQYLSQCIDSILNQTFKDFELILVDDGSPDKCPVICDNYAKKDKRIKVIHKQNGGLVSARKAGLAQATGQYIGFVDSDDWIKLDMYEKMCRVAKTSNADIAICRIILVYDDYNVNYNEYIKSGYYNKQQLIEKVYPKMICTDKFYNFGLSPAVWCKIFKKDILDKNLPHVHNDITVGEDTVCSYPCLLDAESVVIIDDYLYYYRQVVTSMTKSYDAKFFYRIMLVYNTLLEINNKKNVYDILPQLDYYMVYLFQRAVFNEVSDTNNISLKAKANHIREMLQTEKLFNCLQRVDMNNFRRKDKLFIYLAKKKFAYLLMIYTILRCKRKIIRT